MVPARARAAPTSLHTRTGARSRERFILARRLRKAAAWFARETDSRRCPGIEFVRRTRPNTAWPPWAGCWPSRPAGTMHGATEAPRRGAADAASSSRSAPSTRTLMGPMACFGFDGGVGVGDGGGVIHDPARQTMAVMESWDLQCPAAEPPEPPPLEPPDDPVCSGNSRASKPSARSLAPGARAPTSWRTRSGTARRGPPRPRGQGEHVRREIRAPLGPIQAILSWTS